MIEQTIHYIKENLRTKEKRLYVRFQELTGKEATLKLLEQCTHVERLDLSNNHFEDLSEHKTSKVLADFH